MDEENRPDKGPEIRTDPATVDEYVEECRAGGLSEASIRRYRYVIKTLDLIGAQSYQPDEMTPKKLADWAKEIRRTQKRADSHIEVAVRFLKWTAWRQTHPEWINIPHLMPEHLRALKQRSRRKPERREMPVLTPSQVQSLLDACENTANGERNAALIALLWDTGFRIGEALSMHTRDIFQENDYKGIPRWYAYCPHSKTQPRRVVLCDSAPILRAYIKDRDPETPLWASQKGSPLGYHSWKSVLNKIVSLAQRADPGIKFPKGSKSHLFRHSRATFLANQGWTEATIMKHFGWTEPSMAAHYIEQSRIDTGEAFDRMQGNYTPLRMSGSEASKGRLASPGSAAFTTPEDRHQIDSYATRAETRGRPNTTHRNRLVGRAHEGTQADQGVGYPKNRWVGEVALRRREKIDLGPLKRWADENLASDSALRTVLLMEEATLSPQEFAAKIATWLVLLRHARLKGR
jgi:integrase